MNETGTKKEKREVENHSVPSGYIGRCANGEYMSSFVSFGGDLPKGEVLHKFEMRLPIPTGETIEELNESCLDLYNLSLKDIIGKALAKLMTDLDEGFKSVLFEGIESPMDAMLATQEAHLKAQMTTDEWVYKPVAPKKTISVSSVVERLVKAGRITPEQGAQVETVNDLNKLLVEAGIF